MSLDQVVNADAEEELASEEEDEDEIFFQDIDLLQNHGIVSINSTFNNEFIVIIDIYIRQR